MNILAVLGHVDHGKTTFVKNLCNIKIQERGDITTFVSSYKFGKHLIIDNPGHENWRSLQEYITISADLIILIVDGKQGIEENTQTIIDLINTHNKKFITVYTKQKSIPQNIENSVFEKITTGDYQGSFWVDQLDNLDNIGSFLDTLDFTDSKKVYLETHKSMIKIFLRNAPEQKVYNDKLFPVKFNTTGIFYEKTENNLSIQNILSYYGIALPTPKEEPHFQYFFHKINVVVIMSNISKAINAYKILNKYIEKIPYLTTEFVFWTNTGNNELISRYKNCKIITDDSKIKQGYYVQDEKDIKDLSIQWAKSYSTAEAEFIKSFNINNIKIYGFKLIKGTINTGDYIVLSDGSITNIKSLAIKSTIIERCSVVNQEIGIVLKDNNTIIDINNKIITIVSLVKNE